MQLRRIHHLVDMHIGRTGYAGNLASDLLGELIVLLELPSADLNINRRGQPEVQNLIDDVRGLKVEDDIRILFMQHLAQTLPVRLRGVVLLIQRHQELAVLHIRQAAIAKRQVEASVRNSNVVQYHRKLAGRDGLADSPFHSAEDPLYLFNARSGSGPHMQTKRARVHRGEEILPDKWQQGRRQRKEQSKAGHREPGMSQHPAKNALIEGTETLKARVEAIVNAPYPVGLGRIRYMPGLMLLVHLHFTGQQELHHRRHQRSRQQVRGQHGEHHGHSQRREQTLRRSGKKHHRDEYDADRQRRDEGRHRNLRGTIQDRRLDLLALTEVAMDVLDLYRRIVHQDADRQAKPTQRHRIQGLPEELQDDD